MNFKMKALVAAAVVATTMSGAANALTNNDIFLIANGVDAAGVSESFVSVLGQAGTAQAFTGTSNLAIDYSADANWMSFIASATSVQYQVVGFYQSNPAATTSYNAADKLLVSSSPTLTPGKLTNNQMNALMGATAGAGTSFNSFLLDNATLTGTSTKLVVGPGAGGFATASNNVFNNYLNVNTQAALGHDLGFYSVTRPTTQTGLTAQLVAAYSGEGVAAADVWNLNATGQLTYTTATAAVPEADSWAMAMLGLGLMGFVARRRTRA